MFYLKKIQSLYVILPLFLWEGCVPSIPEIRPVPKEDSCQRISSGPGPEDMEILHSFGQDWLVYSSHERRIPGQTGKLYYIPLDSASLGSGLFSSHPLPVDRYPMHFRPHGISHSQFQGKNRLYSISHPRLGLDLPPGEDIPQHTIEIFEEERPGSWKYLSSLSDPFLTSPNDLYALPEERLLISNDIGSDLNFGTALDLIFRRSTSDITYYANSQFYPINAKIPFGNGIWYVGGERPGTKGTLYRASHIEKSIFVYELEWSSESLPILKLQDTIPFPGGPDNLYSNEYGFYTTTHNSDLKFFRHSRSVEEPSPSQVWEIQNGREPRLIFSDPGKEISAASTAIRYQNWLFISQVFESFILVCRIR